ncbi:MAG TPA: GNAT family N-acetyltransferase [Dehalococcoidia bacterium]|nr:GNAT family N-acetyltransferase [Dehalococcoidia bacterium]
MDTHVSRITKFEGNLIKHLFKKAGGSRTDPNPRFFDDEKNIMLISRTDGAVSGFLWAYILDSPNDPFPKLLLLYSIDVFEPFRRRGIATLLIQHLKEIARTHNCRKMWVPTSRTNLAAVALYRRTGGVAQNDDAVMFTYDNETLNA